MDKRDGGPALTDREVDVLRHSLGLDYKDKPFRNHYVADEDHHSWEQIQSLISKGLMVERRPPFPLCGRLFVVTEDGIGVADAVLKEREK